MNTTPDATESTPPLIENPEYETAPFQGVVLDEDGRRLSDMTACLVFRRLKPPRYRRNYDGTLSEVFPYLAPKVSNE